MLLYGPFLRWSEHSGGFSPGVRAAAPLFPGCSILADYAAVFAGVDLAAAADKTAIHCTCAANVGVIGDSALPTRRRYRTRDRTR